MCSAVGIRHRLIALLHAITLALALSPGARADSLTPFTSDGCSAFPDGTAEQQTLWRSCCTAHDFAYWKGGTYQDRVDADFELKRCVAAVKDSDIALLMLAGVRVGGSPFLPTSFRWGYGWPYPRMYGPLTAAEQALVRQMTNGLNNDP